MAYIKGICEGDGYGSRRFPSTVNNLKNKEAPKSNVSTQLLHQNIMELMESIKELGDDDEAQYLCDQFKEHIEGRPIEEYVLFQDEVQGILTELQTVLFN